MGLSGGTVFVLRKDQYKDFIDLKYAFYLCIRVLSGENLIKLVK